jgi:hypothetical protein
VGVDHRPLRSRAPTPSRLLSAGRTAVGCRRDAEPTGWTWNIAGARREGPTGGPGRRRGRHPGAECRLAGRPGGRPDPGRQRPRRQPALIAQALGVGWFRSYAPAWSGTTSGPWPAPTRAVPPTATCWCRGCPWSRWSSCGSPRPAAASSAPRCWSASRSARAGHGGGTHLSNKRGHNLRQLWELQQLAGSRMAPRLLVGDLNLPSTVVVVASRRGWPETGGRIWPNSHPTQQLDHVLWNNPAGVVRPRGATRLS